MAVEWGEGGKYISLEVDKLLDNYCKEVEDVVAKVAAGVSKATANKLRKHSPKGKSTKHYAEGWKSKRVGKKEFIVFNSTKPGLTHLLNNDHATRNGTGVVKGDGHIDEADKWATEEFLKRVKKEL